MQATHTRFDLQKITKRCKYTHPLNTVTKVVKGIKVGENGANGRRENRKFFVPRVLIDKIKGGSRVLIDLYQGILHKHAKQRF